MFEHVREVHRTETPNEHEQNLMKGSVLFGLFGTRTC